MDTREKFYFSGLLIFLLLLPFTGSADELVHGAAAVPLPNPRPALPSDASASRPTAGTLPLCVDDKGTIAEIESLLKANRKSKNIYMGYSRVLSGDSDEELVARLVYSEVLAANCPELNAEMMPGILSVIYNRIKVRKGEVKSVVFQPTQFNSSLHFYSSSRYSDFLCPKDEKLWEAVYSETRKVMDGQSKPQLSEKTVHYFLYKHDPRWKKEPWDFVENRDQSNAELRSCIRFFLNPNWR